MEFPPETSTEDLAKFVAKKVAAGVTVTSVVRILEDSQKTPRVPVLSSQVFKEELKAERLRIEQGVILEKGDYVQTPRFLRVKLQEVFPSENELREAGYTEPTHFMNDRYTVCGRSTGYNHMVFAAAFKMGKEDEA